MTNYDIIIIGGGPAGMTAGIYASRAGMRVLLIERASIGGQVSTTGDIANYPGFKSIDGFTLGQNMFEQMVDLGVEVVFDEIERLDLVDKTKQVVLRDKTYTAPAIILSMGVQARVIGCKGEKEFISKGVSFCAVCDGAFFRGKKVAVVGGGNTALQDAIYLSNVASSVCLIHRRDKFSAQQSVIDEFNAHLAEENSNIKTLLGYTVEEIYGEDRVKGVVLKNTATQELSNMELDGVFVAIGRTPSEELIHDQVELSNRYIKVNNKMQTSIEGVFACGDIIAKDLRQIATAISDGAIAGTFASEYVKKLKSEK